MQRVTGFSLSETLIQEIDSKRGDIPRSKYVEKLLKKALEQGNPYV
jgi:metal-responsive CopG/Arc/MetJ family transcriptional regulator